AAKEARRARIAAERAEKKARENYVRFDGLRATIVGRLDRERFEKYRAATTRIGGRYDGVGNVIQATDNLEQFQKDMEEAGIRVVGLPQTLPQASAAPQTDVLVGIRPSGEITVKHPYSQKMNQAYRSAEETSGIIGFDWEEKVRVIGKGCVTDLEEVLAAIAKNHPEWTVGYSFDVEAWKREWAERRALLRTVTDDMKRLVRPEFTILPCQAEGYNLLCEFGGNALNGD